MFDDRHEALIFLSICVFLAAGIAAAWANCDFAELSRFFELSVKDPAAAQTLVDNYKDAKGCGCQDPQIGCLRIKLNETVYIASRNEFREAQNIIAPWIASADQHCQGLSEGEEDKDREKLQCYRDTAEFLGSSTRGVTPLLVREMVSAHIKNKLSDLLKRLDVLDKGRENAREKSLETRQANEAMEISRALCRTLQRLDEHHEMMKRMDREISRIPSMQIPRYQEAKSKELHLIDQINDLKIKFEQTAHKSFIRSEWCFREPEKSFTLPINIQPTPIP